MSEERLRIYIDARGPVTAVKSRDFGTPSPEPSALCIYHTCPMCSLFYVGTNPRFDYCPRCYFGSRFFWCDYHWTQEEIVREVRKCDSSNSIPHGQSHRPGN